MNDRALYQLERAIDALSQMAKYLREEQTPVSFTDLSSGYNHSSYWYDFDRNQPINFASSSSPDVIVF
jgi:hypothetical protein